MLTLVGTRARGASADLCLASLRLATATFAMLSHIASFNLKPSSLPKLAMAYSSPLRKIANRQRDDISTSNLASPSRRCYRFPRADDPFRLRDHPHEFDGGFVLRIARVEIDPLELLEGVSIPGIEHETGRVGHRHCCSN
jgi:hypothetical protein